MRKQTYYKPSGRFSPISFIYLFLVCFVAIPLLSLAYAYGIWYMPFVYISFIFTGLFGIVTGLLVNFFVINKGKVRNSILAFVFGLLAGLFALYLHWAVWVDLAINITDTIGGDRLGIAVSNIKFLEVFQLALDPVLMLELIKEINEYGTWGVRSATVSGIFLLLIWIIEFVVILGLTIYSSFFKSRAPFCEINNEWFEETLILPLGFIQAPNDFKKQLEAENQNLFDALSPVTNPNQDHSVFILYQSNEGVNFLSITNKAGSLNKDNKIEFEENEFIEYVYISKKLKEKLLVFVSEVGEFSIKKPKLF